MFSSKYFKSHNARILQIFDIIFFKYTEIKQFWREFSNWWYLVFGVKLFLNKDSVIFGILNSDNLVLNYCILQAKYYIHYVKYTQLDRLFISVQAFLKFLKRRLEILEYLYLSKDKHESFVDRWGEFMEVIN